MQDWISVRERLPEPTQTFDYVLVAHQRGITIARYWRKPYTERRAWYGRKGEKLKTITHWMPLPQMPDKEGL